MVMWGFWKGDLEHGDTAGYYSMAARWAAKGVFGGPGVLTFSPLYVAFFGWMQLSFPDAGAATVAHRLLVVLAAGVAVLAILRRIMPRGWAWFGAAWWVLVDWHLQYEVHLFGFAMLAAGGALAGMGRSPWWRGTALAVLGSSALLVRNEYGLASILFAGCCLVDLWRHFEGSARWRAAFAMLLPSAIAIFASGWYFAGDLRHTNWHILRQCFESRQRANLIQVYPFSYLQRHTDWQGDPWRGGGSLMLRDFGRTNPLMMEAFRAAPAKMMEHFRWNLSLLPAGVQEGLFGCYSGKTPPDYALTRASSIPNPVGRTLAVSAILVGGAWLGLGRFLRRRRICLRGSPGVWTWIYLGCCGVTAVVAAVTQRARPSYIFPITLLVLAATLLAARLLLKTWQRRWRWPAGVVRGIPIAGAAALVVGISSNYAGHYTVHPLLDDYRRVSGLRAIAAQHGRKLCANTDSVAELTQYIFTGSERQNWSAVQWSGISESVGQGKSLDAALTEAGVTDFYFRNDGWPLPASTGGGNAQPGKDWMRVAQVTGADGWEYWVRRPADG